MTIGERLASLGAVRAKVALGDIARLFDTYTLHTTFPDMKAHVKLELLNEIGDILASYGLHPDKEKDKP